MLIKATVIWCALLVMAFANGMTRVGVINPRTGERAGHVISSLTLSVAILAVAWVAIGWLAPATIGEALQIGTLWLVLTLAFEFGAGHFLVGRPWDALLEEYNLLRGRMWVVVLLVTTLAPLAAGWVRGFFTLRPV